MQLFHATALGGAPTMAAFRRSATADGHWAAFWQALMKTVKALKVEVGGMRKSMKNFSKALA